MSIVKTRSFLEKSGCGWITSVIIGIVFIVGIIAFGQRGKGSMGDQDQQALIVCEVGDLRLSAQTLRAMADVTARQQYQTDLEQAPALARAQILADALDAAVRAGWSWAAAKKANIEVSDDFIKSEEANQVNEVLKMVFQQYQQTGKATPGQTFETFAKSSEAQRLAGLVAEPLAKIRATPGGEDFIRAQFASAALRNDAERHIQATDDDVRKANQSYDVQTITIAAIGKEDVKAKAEKVAGEVKAEGFEKVAARYSTVGSAQGISASTVARPMPGMLILMQPDYVPITRLQPGQNTELLKTTSGYAIFRLKSVKSNLPPDYDKKKADYRKQYLQTMASTQYSKQIDEQQAANPVKWNAKGYEVLFKLRSATRTVDALLALSKEAAKLSREASSGDMEPSLLAEYAAFDEAWNLATPKQKKDLREQRATVLKDILQVVEDAQIRLDLADIYTELKKGPEAVEALAFAASANNDFEAAGKARYDQIDAKLKKLVASGLVKPADTATIDKELQRWKTDKAAYDKTQAELKKGQAAADKAIEDQKAKFEQERKAREKTSPPKDKPSTGTTPAPK